MHATGIITICSSYCEIIINYGSRYETVFIVHANIYPDDKGPSLWQIQNNESCLAPYFDRCIAKINKAFFIGDNDKVETILLAGPCNVYTAFKKYEWLPQRISELIKHTSKSPEFGPSIMRILIKYNIIYDTEEDNSMQRPNNFKRPIAID